MNVHSYTDIWIMLHLPLNFSIIDPELFQQNYENIRRKAEKWVREKTYVSLWSDGYTLFWKQIYNCVLVAVAQLVISNFLRSIERRIFSKLAAIEFLYINCNSNHNGKLLLLWFTFGYSPGENWIFMGFFFVWNKLLTECINKGQICFWSFNKKFWNPNSNLFNSMF